MEGVLGYCDSFGRGDSNPVAAVKEKPLTGNSKETCARGNVLSRQFGSSLLSCHVRRAPIGPVRITYTGAFPYQEYRRSMARCGKDAGAGIQ